MSINKISLTAFMVLFTIAAFGQKKRDVIKNRIKSVTEMHENVEEGRKPIKTGYVVFDRTGEVLEELKIKSDGRFDSHIKYEYDSKGNCIKEINLDEKGQAEYYVEIEYDALGNKTKETQYNLKGKKEKTTEYKYNSDGLKTERIVTMPDGKIKTKKKYVYEFE